MRLIQSLYSYFLLFLVVILGCSQDVKIVNPLIYASTHIDLGEQWSGENFSLTYAYEASVDARIKEIKTNCGILNL